MSNLCTKNRKLLLPCPLACGRSLHFVAKMLKERRKARCSVTSVSAYISDVDYRTILKLVGLIGHSYRAMGDTKHFELVSLAQLFKFLRKWLTFKLRNYVLFAVCTTEKILL